MRSLREQVGVHQALRALSTAEEACSMLADYVFAAGDMMPSIYLEHDGRLRCIAQRGLWQVLDGLSGEAGVTGRTWATNTPIEIDSVTRSPEYLEAIPGVVAEICVPIVVAGRSVGALNVESLSPLPADTLSRMRTYAQLLGRRLAVIGFQSEVSSWQRSARASARIADLVFNRHHPGDTLRVICEAALHDSACLIRDAAETSQWAKRSDRLPTCSSVSRRASEHRSRVSSTESRRATARANRRDTASSVPSLSEPPALASVIVVPLARQQSPDRHDRSGQHPSPPDHPRRRRTPRAPRRATRGDAPEPHPAHLIAEGGGSVLGGGGLGVADGARPA